MTVVVAATGRLAEEVSKRVAEWSAAGYIRTSVWVLQDDDGRRVCAVEDGSIVPCRLGEALARRSDPVTLVGLALPDEDGQIGTEATRHLEDVQRDLIDAAPSEPVGAPALVLVPTSATTPIELPTPAFLLSSVVVVVPEDMPSPVLSGDTFDASDDQIVAAHAAHALACLAGIWCGQTSGSPFVERIADVSSRGSGRRVSLVRCHSRLVDAGYLPAHVVLAAVRPGSTSWPNPDRRRFERANIPDSELERMSVDYLHAHRDVLGATEVEEAPAPSRRRLPLWPAIKLLFREALRHLAQRPFVWADRTMGAIFDRWAERVERLGERFAPDSGIAVIRWHERAPGESIGEFMRRQLARVEYVTPDGAIRPAWSELFDLTTGLVDGGSLPAWVDHQKLVHGDFRLIEERRERLVPDPEARPPLEGIWQGRVCDPRSLGPAVAQNLAQLKSLLTQMPTAAPDQGSVDRPNESTEDARAQLEARVRHLESWYANVSASLLWRVGSKLASEAAQVAMEAEGPTDEEWEEVERTIEKMDRRERRRRRWLLLRSVVGVGVIVAILLIHVSDVVKALVVLGAVVAWWLLFFRDLWHALVRPRRRDRKAVEATSALLERTLVGVVRRADCKRLEHRYQEYLDWAEVIGHFVYRPWASRIVHDGGDDQESSRVDPDVLPAACVLAYPAVSNADAARLVGRARARVFTPGWLSRLSARNLDSISVSWQTTDLHQELVEPDPRADTSDDPEGLRNSTVRAVRLGHFRSYDQSSDIADALAQLGQEPLARVISSIAEASHADEPLPPPVEWYDRPYNLDRLADTVRESVIHVLTGSGVPRGTGVIISEAGLAATCRHCVEGIDAFSVVTADGERHPARLHAISKTSDLAVLQIDATRSLSFTPLGRADELAQGEHLFTMGNEYFDPGMGESTLSWGVVTARVRQMRGPLGLTEPLLQTNYPAGPGHSGSPVFNLRCEVVGIHTGGRSELAEYGARALHISLAVPAEELIPLLSESGEEQLENRPPMAEHLKRGEDAVAVPLWSFLAPLLLNRDGVSVGAYGASVTDDERRVCSIAVSPPEVAAATAAQMLQSLPLAAVAGSPSLDGPLRVVVSRIDQTASFEIEGDGTSVLGWFANPEPSPSSPEEASVSEPVEGAGQL